MTRVNFILKEKHQKPPTYGHVTKLFLELEFQHKGNKQTKKKLNSKQNLANFSAATDSECKNFLKYYTEKDKTKFGVNFYC